MNYADKFTNLVDVIKNSDQPIEDKIGDLEFVEKTAKDFINFINAVYDRVIKTPRIHLEYTGQEFRDMMEKLKSAEASRADVAIDACHKLNRRCQFYGIEPFCAELPRNASEIDKKKVFDFIGQFVIETYYKGIEERQQVIDKVELEEQKLEEKNQEQPDYDRKPVNKIEAFANAMADKLDENKAFKEVSNPALLKLAELEDLSHLSKNQFKALDQALTMENLDTIRNMKEIFLSEYSKDSSVKDLKLLIEMSSEKVVQDTLKRVYNNEMQEIKAAHEKAEKVYETKAFENINVDGVQKTHELVKNALEYCKTDDKYNWSDGYNWDKFVNMFEGSVVLSKNFDDALMSFEITNIETGEKEKIENVSMKDLKDYVLSKGENFEFETIMTLSSYIVEVNKEPGKDAEAHIFDGNLAEYVYCSDNIQENLDKYKDYLSEGDIQDIENKMQRLEHEEAEISLE